MPRVISIYLSESCMWIQNLARILQDSCKISHSKGVDEKSHLFSVLLIKNSDISRDIWFSVSFSYQKHINNFSGIQNLARFLQDSCKILNPGYSFFHWIRLRNLFSKQKLASKMFPKTLVPRFIFWPWLISCKILARILQVLNHLARFLQDLNPLITRVLVYFYYFINNGLQLWQHNFKRPLKKCEIAKFGFSSFVAHFRVTIEIFWDWLRHFLTGILIKLQIEFRR